MQRVSFLRLTAESSSVLDGEETVALRLRQGLRRTNPITQPLRGCGGTPLLLYHFALRVLDVVKTPFFL